MEDMLKKRVGDNKRVGQQAECDKREGRKSGYFGGVRHSLCALVTFVVSKDPASHVGILGESAEGRGDS